MAKKELSKGKALGIIQSILLIVVGILLACSIINNNILTILIGIIVAVLGAFILFENVYESRSFISAGALIGGILVGIGIASLCNYVPLSSVFTSIIIVAICCLGGLLLIQGVVNLLKKRNNLTTVTYLVVGILALVFGLLLIFVNQLSSYTLLIAGILFAVYGLISLVMLLRRL